MPTQKTCKSCGATLQGVYCHVCGEKFITPEDKSVKKWLGDLLSSIWMLDGKLIKTLKLLVFRPGTLAKDFVEGKRKPYVRPLNIFLIANVIYFLVPSFDTFKTSLQTQRFNNPYGMMVKYAVEVKMESKGLDFEEYAAQYDQKTGEVSKLILIVLAPLTGLLLFALFRKQGLYLSDGFGLGLQFWAFFILVFILFLPYLDQLLGFIFGLRFFTRESFISISALIISAVYLFFQMKPWQGKKMAWYVIKLLIFAAAFIPVLTIYRFILFWATWLSF